MGLISRVSSRTYRNAFQCKNREGTCLPRHSNFALNKDFVYYPGGYLMSTQQHQDYLHHPNRNIDFSESHLLPFPQAPRFADKDPELNAIRAKAAEGHWGELSIEETNKLYDGHFQRKYFRYHQPNDRWKGFFALIFFALGLAMFKYRTYATWEGFHHPEYMHDPKFLEEYVKRGLQINAGHMRGMSTKWNYQNGEWNEPLPWYKFWQFKSPRESGQLGFSKWYKE